MQSVVIVGSSGHAKVVVDILREAGKYHIAGFLDSNRQPGEKTCGYAVLGQEEDLPTLMQTHALQGFIVAIGDNFIRAKVAARIRKLCPNLAFVTAIHPTATIGMDVQIADGSVVMAGACINPCSIVGQGCIVNTRAVLDHDGSLGDFASLAPGVTAGGNCHIGAFAALGIGAVVVHGREVGEHTVIGAGSLVMHSIGAQLVAYGIPAKTIRSRAIGDKYL